MSTQGNRLKPAADVERQSLASQPWSDGIAIIGMSARFPRSRNVQEFWQHLVNGDVLIENLDAESLRREGVTDATLADSSYVKRGNDIEDADCLDAGFFGLTRREAEILDPQHRVFLECAWEALENAGRSGAGERVGVFAGAGMNTYILQLLANPRVLASAGGYQLMLANDKDFLATRAAYKLDLRGPSVTVQTACSTSLAAVHLACSSLLSRECSMALAGGVSISFPQSVGYSYIPGMILSPDGYCRPFDADAGGTVPGRGAGVVVLKRLTDAVADGDSIVAVIRGSAWNNDGAGKVGYTAPSIDGQAEVIRAALAAAGIDAARVGYVETHGTATELGDAIEFAALSLVFDAETRQRPLVLGAVKANIGHADVAAGVAGLIKAALVVNSGLIPPTPTFKRPNPVLGIEKTPFRVTSSSVNWKDDGERWAGVSSFGIGGTNVHVVLSGAPAVELCQEESGRPCIFPVSAKSAPALHAACEQLSQHLIANTTLSASDVSTTLQLGRHGFGFRRAVVAESCAEAAIQFQKSTRKPEPGTDLSRNVIFLFPGQGQQFPGMTQALYREDSGFRQVIDAGCLFLQEHVGLDLRPFLTGNDKSPALSDRFRDTQIAQPALVLVEYALAERLRSLGIQPAGMLGHSLGELTAACVAGVFSFEDGLRLAADRGRLMAQTPRGGMLAVMLPPEKLNPLLESGTWLAAENGPKMSVASGPVDAIERLERRLAAEGVAVVRLASKNAFHTPLMADAAKAFRSAVAGTTRHAPTIPWLSNISGTWITSTEAQDPQYWANQILSPVRFTRCLATLADNRRLLLETGPGEALLGISRQQLSTSVMVGCLGAENRRTSDAAVFRQAVATAWECGVSIKWKELNPETKARRVPLPTYPFERQRYWVERVSAIGETVAQPAHSLPELSHAQNISPAKRDDVSSWFYASSWRSTPPASIVLPAQAQDRECWLVLADEGRFCDEMVAALRRRGDPVICVKAGKSFAWHDGDAVVDLTSATDLDLLWKHIDDFALRPSGLLCFSGLDGKSISPYDAVLKILQTAGAHRRHLKRFEFITDSLESVCGESVKNPDAAELHGLAHTIPVEFDGQECRCIDVDLSGGSLEQLIPLLLEELSTTGPGLGVAYRRGLRWQKGRTQAPLKQSSESPFRQSGVYIITGGGGGIGHVLAKHLLSRHRARVVIVGRTALPDRIEWEPWIAAHSDDDARSRLIRRMQELEGAGGEVLFMAADVADLAAMQGVFDEARKRFGPLNGVIHAAGVAGGSRILAQSAEEARKIRKPKVQGSRVLAELLQGSSIDFLLLCSSISADIPAPSQSAYSAANAFQNSFAEYCRSVLNIPAIAIGFDAWREAGMMAEAVVPEGLELYYAEKMSCAMTNQEGIEVIYRVLGQWRGAHILTSTIDCIPTIATPYGDAVARLSSVNPTSTPVDSSELAAIIEIWKDLLGIDSISPSDNFFNLGGHSLMGTMMIARIREQLGVTLSLRELFEAPTPERLTEIVRNTGGKPSSGHDQQDSVEEQEREVFEI